MTIHHVRPTCSRCMFWVNEHAADPPTVGHCHRYPPNIYVNPQTGTIIQKFPSTDHHHWCGVWSDDDASLAEAAKRTVITDGKVHEERWFVDTEQWKAAF